MEPRLSTSRKWSPLPAELLQQIQSVFKQSFSKEIGGGTIEAAGKIFPEEILISVGFREKNSLKQSNFIISIAYQKNKDNVLKLLHLAVDAAASLFEQLFAADNDHDFPRLWEEVQFEGRTIYVQYDTTNSDLEAQADKLLGKGGSDQDVAQGDWDDDISAEQIKAQLGLDDDEDEGGSEPH
jgi:hypothetical protein